MLDVVIVGAGVCGLALARSLHLRGQDFQLFEARARLGGRIASAVTAESGLVLDLGPTWYWPQTQPLFANLVSELGLADFPQYEDGAALHLNDPDKAVERIEDRRFHEGARRLDGGMVTLVDALAEHLPAAKIHLGHVLMSVRGLADRVALTFEVGGASVEVEARHGVLAVPPRLLDEHVMFEPMLDDALRDAMRNAATWMAAQAKAVVAYDRHPWRGNGFSGAAFVTHEQAVLGEIFDACDGSGEKAALGGFLALTPALRSAFADGLPMLINNQMTQVFGSALEQGELHYRDWATERFTCSALDIEAPAAETAGIANPLLRQPQWEGRLFLGGTETATRGAGHVEGALYAAQRIDRALGRALPEADRTPDDDGSVPSNEAVLAQFHTWAVAQRDSVFENYRRRLHRGLAAQQREQLTQIAMLGAMEDVFADALGVLETLSFDMQNVAVDRGRSALTPEIQKPFRDVMQSLQDDVIAFNRTSCALSNFPDESRPAQEYIRTILRDIAAAWREFSLAANRILVAKAGAAEQSQSSSAIKVS